MRPFAAGAGSRGVLIALSLGFILTGPAGSVGSDFFPAGGEGRVGPWEADSGRGAALEDVTWSVDSVSGLRYRPASAQERETHRWSPGTLLVEQPRGALVPGAPTASLLIPAPTGGMELFQFRLLGAEASVPYATWFLDAEPAVSYPAFYDYEPLARSAWPALQLSISDAGAFAGRGVASGRWVEVYSPEPTWALDDPGAVGGPIEARDLALVVLSAGGAPLDACAPVPEACAPSPQEGGPAPACSDGVDNDADELVDLDDPGCADSADSDEAEPDRTLRFGLFGEIKWCTEYAATWSLLAHRSALEIRDAFHRQRPTRAELQHSTAECWIAKSTLNGLPDRDLARECDRASAISMCRDLEGHAYTFWGCFGQLTCYLDKAWQEPPHWRLHNSAIGPLDLTQVLHLGEMARGSSTTCGAGYLPPSGASAANGPGPHEDLCGFSRSRAMGNNFGAISDYAAPNFGDPLPYRPPYEDWARDCYTVEVEAVCQMNWFSSRSRAVINLCVLRDFAACPRIGTG